jgi:hypothetical protein
MARIVFGIAIMGIFSNIMLSCSSEGITIPPENEIVMTEGMRITVKNSYGEMTITAGKGTLRHYTWNNGTRTAILIPRKERWNGSLGIYYPGEGNHWEEHDGITRAVLEEGQQHFNSVDKILEWIRKENHWGYVYRDDGLVVGWEKMEGAGGTLGVSVWQVFINGKKPTRLTGSQNDSISVKHGETRISD